MISPLADFRRKLLLWLAACGMVGLSGCHREFYRKQADQEAQELVEEKSTDARWALPGFQIEMHPASRFYDPYDPVRPPMPPDDPESHELMHCVYGKTGWSKWHENGDLSELENPSWQQQLDRYATRTESGAYQLRLEDSVRLALIHSPAYQQQLETVYLSSLDVSTERFRLQTQFFGGNSTTYATRGDSGSFGARGAQPTGQGGASSVGSVLGGAFSSGNDRLDTSTGLLMRRRFATAGELVVGFANSFVWQFAGPDQSAAASLANFSVLQPLLRAGGRVIGLEQLTIAERTLLANVRAMYRYRQGFFTQIAIGDNSNVTGPQRRGGFQGGTGLTGFTGQGTSGFGGVGDATGLGRGANLNAGAGGAGGVTSGFVGGGAGTVGGFVGLLQQLQQIRNTQSALNAQLRTLALLEANLAAGLIDIAQVDQFRQNIESERANLLQARNNLDNSLDGFKTGTLGLPPDLPIELNDSLIQPFQFIDPDMGAVQDGLATILSDLGDLDEKPKVVDVEALADRLAALRRDIEEQFQAVLGDLQRLDSIDASRFKELTPEEQQATRDDWTRLKETRERLLEAHAETAKTLGEIRAGLTPETTDKVTDDLVTLSVRLANIVNELSLVQARSRLEVITVESLDLEALDALAIARANRVDWMNNRAALVDTWRLIEFNANALESGLDLVFSGDIGTTGNNPLEFRHANGGLRAGLRFDAPFTRLQERNNYRQQLINYQQARRQLIQFEDGVHRTLRTNLRQLNQLRTNLEIQRRAVAIAIRRVDQTRENLSKPVPPAAPGGPPSEFGPTAAVNLLTALSDLRSSQNNFMSVWLNYYAAHMQLIRDLGVMRIDQNGLWVQEPLDHLERAWPQDCPLPPDVPQEWYQKLEHGAGASPSYRADDPTLRPMPSPAAPRRRPILPTPPEAAPVSPPAPAPAEQRREGTAPREPFLHPDDFSSKPISIPPKTKLTTINSPVPVAVGSMERSPAAPSAADLSQSRSSPALDTSDAVRLRASTRLPVIVPRDERPPSDHSELPKIVPAGTKS